jgi:hypothetical protein
MAWNPPPVPKQEYNYEVEILVAEYKRAAERIRDLLLRAPIDMKSIDRQKLLREIIEILRELDAAAEEWIEKNIPQAYRQGAAGTIITLGEATTIKKALEMVSTNRLNRQFIEAMIADTMEDLLQMTRNTELQVKKFIRQLVGEQLRRGAIEGESGRKQISDISKATRRQAEKTANFAIRDRANRIWSIEAYARMVTRTKIMQAHLEGTTNEALSRGAQYATISSHNSRHATCRRWEGRIVKLSEEAPGNYPTLAEARMSGIFHPGCQHSIHPFRNPSVLPRQLQDLNKTPMTFE